MVQGIDASDTVLGVLPIHLAASVCERGARYGHLEMSVPANRRGTELSADELDSFGAKIVFFTVVHESFHLY